MSPVRWLRAVAVIGATALLMASSCSWQLGTPIPEGVPPPAGDPVPQVDTHAKGRPADQLHDWAAERAPALGIPVTALEAYAYAARVAEVENPDCHIGWTDAGRASGMVESHHGTYRGATIAPNGDVTPPIRGVRLDGTIGNLRDHRQRRRHARRRSEVIDRAMGPMQFIPETWRLYGVDANNDGKVSPDNFDDAALSAAGYLCWRGKDLATPRGWMNALRAYNLSDAVRPHRAGLGDRLRRTATRFKSHRPGGHALGCRPAVQTRPTKENASAHHRAGRSPRNPRLPRQPDGRGRGGPDRRHVRPGGGAVRRVHRRARGRRTARRRLSATAARACRRPSRRCSTRSHPRSSGLSADDQRLIDQALLDLDGTPDKSRLGANAILGVSLAVAKAAAESAGLPLFRYLGGPNAHILPVPMMNILNGGAHADTGVDVQEFMVAPIGAPSFKEALRWGAEVYHSLKSVLKKQGLATGLGDEGGFAPDVAGTKAALDLIMLGDRGGGLQGRHRRGAGTRCRGHRILHRRNGLRFEKETRSADQMTEFYAGLIDAYPLVSIEDPLSEDDWDGWVDADDGDRRPRPDRRRRPLRHQPRAARGGHRAGRGERAAGEGEPDRHADRDARCGRRWRTTADTAR